MDMQQDYRVDARAPVAASFVEADVTENLRQMRIAEYSILRTARETLYDRFVFTAAQLFRVPIAALSLMGAEGTWFKSSVGLAVELAPRGALLCDHIHTSDGILVVEDASIDKRLADNMFVRGEPHVRFYAGAALITPDGIRVGTICVCDRVPKTLLARQEWQLAQLANSIVTTLEARRPSPTLS
jgi:GAF domain-containing protein